MSSLAIIIVNYNGETDTLECLESLESLKVQSEISFQTFLVDNGSKNPLRQADIQKYNIEYYPLNENFGFAGGNNYALKSAIKTGYDYYALINNDTIIDADSVIKIVKELDKRPDIGIGGIVNYYYSNPNKIWQAGAKLNKFFFRFKSIRSVDNQSSTFEIVDYVPGSSFFIRNDLISKIGMLDEDYFAYYEESDYCMRCQKAGFKVAYLPTSRILHKVGKSSTSVIRQYLRDRNHLHFCSLYGNKYQMLMVYLQIVVIAVINFIKKGCNFGFLKYLKYSIIDFKNENYGKGRI